MIHHFTHHFQPQLILASSSVYRRDMLKRLNIPFDIVAPETDESILPGENPLQSCIRLAENKAFAVSKNYPKAVVIGSDQIAIVNGQAISKPGDHQNACLQLKAMSGQTITFHSAVCIYCNDVARKLAFEIPTQVTFRVLDEATIERYLLAEKPYDCAGSAKSEGLGITLLEKIESCDPTALIGLPLIALSNALRQWGFYLP